MDPRGETLPARGVKAGWHRPCTGWALRVFCRRGEVMDSLYSFLADVVDVLHAGAMVAWVGGLPLLFWRRWPRLTTLYIYYSILFILVSQVSDFVLGECFLTTLARALRHLGGVTEPDRTWFTIRMAEQVFRLRPSEAAVRVVTKVLVLIVCVGTLIHMFRTHRTGPTLRRYPHGAKVR